MGQLDAGLFAGTDKAIHGAFDLKEGEHLKQWTTCREVAGHRVSADVLVDLVRRLHRSMGAKLRKRKPSAENWRWETQTHILDRNKSPEVLIERAVALLAKRGCLSEWCNQIPVASGLVDHKSDKRAAVDLAKLAGSRLDLYELKWTSDTPIYAAFEILRYGLAYLLCHVNRTELGYTELDAMKVSTLGLNVLAPPSYYEKLNGNLAWLQEGLDTGIRTLSQELLGPRASFQFLALPVEPTDLFASGAEAKAACRDTPLVAPKALALMQAMSGLAPVWPACDSI